MNVWVSSIDGKSVRPVTRETRRGIRTFHWSQSGRHILFLQDQDGDENWHLYAVDLKDDSTRDLTPLGAVQAQLIAVEPRKPNEVLVGLNAEDPQLHDVYRVNLETSELSLEIKNFGAVAWLANADLNVKAAMVPERDGGFRLLIQDDVTREWDTKIVFSSEDAFISEPIAFGAHDESLFLITSQDANTGRLVRYSLSTGESELIEGDPTYDVASVDLDPATRRPRVVTYHRARSEYRLLDPSIESDWARMRELHFGDPRLVSTDLEDRLWLVSFAHDQGPTAFFLYDRNNKEAKFLFEDQPLLKEFDLAPMEPFSFQARDGLNIHGYLTRPRGGASESLPTVINVHGGPWVRDRWGYSAEAQWLADLGFVCAQINFRGSGGYGKDFMNSGDREWGGKMQEDVNDGVSWLVRQGITDPSRVGIYGASYGGYAALVGVTSTPKLFKCAVALCAPTNLITFIECIPPYWAPLVEQLHVRLGHPERDRDFLWSRSPLSQADKIESPVFLAHGANDPRVKKEEADRFIGEMKRKGIEYEYLIFSDEGHGLTKPENRLKFYEAAGFFLRKHLQLSSK